MDGRSAADPGFNPDAVVRLPVQYWTFMMSNSKRSRIATRAKSHARTRPWLECKRLGFKPLGFRSLEFEFAGHVSLSPSGGGPGPAAGLLNGIKPLFGLTRIRHGRAQTAPRAPSERRRGGGQSGVGSWRTHSSPHVIPVYMTETRVNFKIEIHAKYLSL